MGVSLPSKSGSRSPSTLSEINVTPLVDVMLVLLIVFMISAPMMKQGVNVDLPKAASGSLNESKEQVILEINAKQQFLINGKQLKQGTLLLRLKEMARAKPNLQVAIQADQSLSYGFVAQVMSALKKSNIHRVGLVTSPSTEKINF